MPESPEKAMQPKVLFLGWEYAPFVNGGLGIACTHLANELTNICDLKVVLPQVKKPEVKKAPEAQVIGMNQPEYDYIEEEQEVVKIRKAFKTMEVKVSLFPYSNEEIVVSSKKHYDLPYAEKIKTIKKVKRKITKAKPTPSDRFQTDTLFGNDIIKNVILYSKYVCKIAENLSFDIIHANDWMTFMAGMELKEKYGAKLILHIHSLEYDRAGAESRKWIRELEKDALNKADQVIAVSQYSKNLIQYQYNIDPKKIAVIYNGMEPIKPFHTKKRFKDPLVLFLGRVSGQKGPEYFLDVAKRVHRKNKNIRFIMAGHGDQLDRLVKISAEYNLGDRFHFTGYVDRGKVFKLFSMADIYCMPSVSEPFGLSAIEAAQFGIPIVLSERSGVAEVLPGALKANFWDVDLMAQHILTLLSNASTREISVKNNTNSIRNLTWFNAAKEVLSVYDKTLDNHNQN